VLQPPSAICHIRSEMFIGTSSLVIECTGNSLTHRDYEPGYPHVRVAGFFGHLPRTLIDLNSSVSALPGSSQLRFECSADR
jgi:hypothetical protein